MAALAKVEQEGWGGGPREMRGMCPRISLQYTGVYKGSSRFCSGYYRGRAEGLHGF